MAIVRTRPDYVMPEDVKQPLNGSARAAEDGVCEQRQTAGVQGREPAREAAEPKLSDDLNAQFRSLLGTMSVEVEH